MTPCLGVNGVERGDGSGAEPGPEGKYPDIGCGDEDDVKGDCSDAVAKIDGDGIATCKFGCDFVGAGIATGASAAGGGPVATTTSSDSCGSG